MKPFFLALVCSLALTSVARAGRCGEVIFQSGRWKARSGNGNIRIYIKGDVLPHVHFEEFFVDDFVNAEGELVLFRGISQPYDSNFARKYIYPDFCSFHPVASSDYLNKGEHPFLLIAFQKIPDDLIEWGRSDLVIGALKVGETLHAYAHNKVQLPFGMPNYVYQVRKQDYFSVVEQFETDSVDLETLLSALIPFAQSI